MPLPFPPVPLLAGVGDIASASTAILLGLSGLMGGVFHYAAILWRLPEHDVEFTTAIGFFFGFAAAAAILLSEVL
jgi:hypothetical protein